MVLTENEFTMAQPVERVNGQNSVIYTWLFLAVRRSDVMDRPHRHQVTAPTYDAARRLVARDYVAAFAGRLPTGVAHHV